jgi:hypothetical protein
MKELPVHFEGKGQVKGYAFTQISKTDKGFIYEVEQGGYKHYEVFKKLLNRRFGTVSYPTDKAFGVWAWTSMSLEKAKAKLLTIKHQKGMSLV